MDVTLHLLYDEEVFRQNITGRSSDWRIILLVAPSPHRESESGEFTAKAQRAQRKRIEGEKPGKCEVEKLTFTTSLLLILLFFSAIFAFSAVSEPFSKLVLQRSSPITAAVPFPLLLISDTRNYVLIIVRN